jgi:hypothetical protein
MTDKRVGVSPPGEYEIRRRFFSGLSRLFPVTFHPCDNPGADRFDALIALNAESTARMAAEPRAASLFGVNSAGDQLADPRSCAFRFGRNPALDRMFWGRRLCERASRPIGRLDPTGEILASHQSGPAWILQANGAMQSDIVALPLPVLGPRETLGAYYRRDRFFDLLPLLHFLHRVVSDVGWRGPAIRAAFMFDDPNLHRMHFGYLRYHELAEQSEKHDYHVSIATVPFDTWFVNQAAARIFRGNARRLSLLAHGNHHLRRELAQPLGESLARSLVAQSLQRLRRLEAKSGLRVPRVMTAPHEACCDNMAKHLLQGGYEAAAISLDAVIMHNPHIQWPPEFGLQPAEFFTGGLPVLPRFPLSDDCEVDVLLSAYAGQPIIPVGHHQDLKHGVDLLNRVASLINGLGAVEWCDMRQMARTNIKSRIRGSAMEIRMFARCIDVRVPAGVEEIVVSRPWLSEKVEPERLAFSVHGTSQRGSTVLTDASVLRLPPGAGRLEIASVAASTFNSQEIKRPPIMPWALIRRGLAEGRDRLQPLFGRFSY